MLGKDKANIGGVIIEGQSYDLGNFLRTRLSGKRLLGSTLAKARSKLMPLFQQPELKLAASLVLPSRASLLILAQPAKHSLSGMLS